MGDGVQLILGRAGLRTVPGTHREVGKMRKEGFRTIINDDCDSHNRLDMEFYELWGAAGITTYSLCVGTNVAYYDTKVVDSYKEMIVRAREEAGLDAERNRAEEGSVADWYRILVEEGKDPLAFAVEGCHANGMEVFASQRMNDIHHGAYTAVTEQRQQMGVSAWWRAHPELRAKGWDRRAWASLNFEFPEVREYRLKVVREVASGYDIDGFDLDFMRMPPFFDRGRERACAHHMTDLVREARKILDEEGARKGKRMKLSAGCMRNVRRCEEVGLEVRRWVEEGLVDILIPAWLKQDGTDLPIEEIAGGPVRAVFIRAPFVTRTGEGVEVLARSEDKVVMVRQGNLLATAFHPELTNDSRVQQYFLDMIEAAYKSAPKGTAL